MATSRVQPVPAGVGQPFAPSEGCCGLSLLPGLGEIAFGRAVRACTELTRAIALAEEHGLGELSSKAEAAMTRIREGVRVSTKTLALPVPPEFTYISDALYGARAAALAECV